MAQVATPAPTTPAAINPGEILELKAEGSLIIRDAGGRPRWGWSPNGQNLGGNLDSAPTIAKIPYDLLHELVEDVAKILGYYFLGLAFAERGAEAHIVLGGRRYDVWTENHHAPFVLPVTPFNVTAVQTAGASHDLDSAQRQLLAAWLCGEHVDASQLN